MPALYLNVFVAIAQVFQKLPFLQPLAPTQSEPPFIVTQVIVMAVFFVLGFVEVKSLHSEPKNVGVRRCFKFEQVSGNIFKLLPTRPRRRLKQ